MVLTKVWKIACSRMAPMTHNVQLTSFGCNVKYGIFHFSVDLIYFQYHTMRMWHMIFKNRFTTKQIFRCYKNTYWKYHVSLLKLQCCGNHGYDDWNKLPRPMPVPKSCCKLPNCDAQDETQIYREVDIHCF